MPRRLQDGDPLHKSFMAAMASSRVIVPIVSTAALERMMGLTAASPCDNVLLEWSLALELSKQRGTKVYPLLIGTP